MIRRTLRYIFIEDFIAKLICLVIGAGLWLYVEFARVSQTTINVQIEYIKKPQNLYLKSGQTRFVKITIRGRDEFIKFSTTALKAEVNLENAKGGEAKYPLIFDARQLPERVDVVQKPEAISVALERALFKKVAIRAVTVGTPDSAFRLQRTSTNPREIEVEGPTETVKNLTSIDTEPVDIEGAQRSFSRKVNLRLPESISINKTKEILVRVDFIPKTYSEEKKFEHIPVKIQNLDSQLLATLSDATVQVLLQGESSAIKSIDASEIYAYINAEDTRYNARTGSILPYANETGVLVRAKILSAGKKIQIVSVTPENISVRYSVKPEFQKKSQPSGEEAN